MCICIFLDPRAPTTIADSWYRLMLPMFLHVTRTHNSFSFSRLFIDVLQQHGPLHYRDARIQLELQNFPLSAQSIIRDAGGVSSFLLQSLKFAVKDEFVCLLTDAARARELSEDYKRNPLNYALMDDVINQQVGILVLR